MSSLSSELVADNFLIHSCSNPYSMVTQLHTQMLAGHMRRHGQRNQLTIGCYTAVMQGKINS